MGFGYLFLGYLVLMNLLVKSGFTKILAYLIMLIGVKKLSVYEEHLKTAYFVLFPMLLVGGWGFFLEIADLTSLFPDAEQALFFRLFSLLAALLELLFSANLLKGIQALAKETGVYVIEVKAFRNRLFTILAYILYLAGQLNYPEGFTRFLIYYNLVIHLFTIVVMFLNAKLIYEAYMWICTEEDLDMGRRRSRIPFIDRILERMDRSQEASLERRKEADRAYRAEKAQKKKNRQSNRKKGRK